MTPRNYILPRSQLTPATQHTPLTQNTQKTQNTPSSLFRPKSRMNENFDDDPKGLDLSYGNKHSSNHQNNFSGLGLGIILEIFIIKWINLSYLKRVILQMIRLNLVNFHFHIKNYVNLPYSFSNYKY